MDPITIILLAATLFGGATAAAGIISVAYLTLRAVISWFQTKVHLMRGRDQMVAVTVLDRLANGRYRTVQGVFNQQTNSWVEHRTIESEGIDAELATRHRYRRSVIHTI